MRRKHRKTRPGRLVLIRRPQRPESDWTTPELGEPALQLRLRRVVGQTTQMEDLAALGKEGPHIGTSIHRPSHDLRMIEGRLGLADQPPQHASQRNGLLHGPAGRRGGQGLQMEWEVVFDRRGGLNGLDFQGGADVGQRTGAERQRLRMMRLPSLVLGAQVKGPRVLQIWRQHHSLVPGLPRQLDTQIPRVQRHKGKLEVLADEVFLGKGVEAVDGVPEGTCGTDMLPGESGQARWTIRLANPQFQDTTYCREA